MYTALPDPLAAFAADVRYAAQLVQAGCNKQNSLYAQEYLDKCERARAVLCPFAALGFTLSGLGLLPAALARMLPPAQRSLCIRLPAVRGAVPCSSARALCLRPLLGQASGPSWTCLPLPAAAPELSALAVSKLEHALREIRLTGAADYLAQHAPLPGQRRASMTRPTPEPASQAGDASAAAAPAREASAEPASQAAGEAGDEGTPGAGSERRGAGQRQLTDSVRDLDRCAPRAAAACIQRWLQRECSGRWRRPHCWVVVVIVGGPALVH